MNNLKIGILDPEGKNKNPLNGNEYSETYKKLSSLWKEYPAYEKADEILKLINELEILLVIWGTGWGKTVLLPKFVLHHFKYDGKIAITLPKQIITKWAAEFWALTLDVELGKEVGYVFKWDSNRSKDTKLLYATDGTIVSMLLKDPEINNFDAIIIDEAHERKVQIDLLLYLIKNAIMLRRKNNPLK